MANLSENLGHMQRHGQSVQLSWGEDTGLWECSWITSGERYTAFSRYPTTAAQSVRDKAYAAPRSRRSGGA
jgi:hypothetical protein